MALDFTGKIVLITGGGNGIGAACARRFAEAGARVAVIDRDSDAARGVAAEIGNGASGYQLDVSDGEAFARLTADIAAARRAASTYWSIPPARSPDKPSPRCRPPIGIASWRSICADPSTARRRSFRT